MVIGDPVCANDDCFPDNIAKLHQSLHSDGRWHYVSVMVFGHVPPSARGRLLGKHRFSGVAVVH